MKIEHRKVKVRDIFNGYCDNGDNGVVGMQGMLDIRPPYQREYVYDVEKAEKVVQTVLKGFPLNVMYWSQADNGHYEVLDGQQRTLSIMKFLSREYEVEWRGSAMYWDVLTIDELNQILDYELDIYVCEGSDSEKLEWFKIVNIAGVPLTEQDLRNATYRGPWVDDAKKKFSKPECGAKKISEKLIKGTPVKQEYLEKTLKGIVEYEDFKSIESYMSSHKNDANANELWNYFEKVIQWVDTTFGRSFPHMDQVNWFTLYNHYHKNTYNPMILQLEVRKLLEDDEIQNKKNIYAYVLSKDKDPYAEKKLNLRTFSKNEKMTVYQKQNGKCAACGQSFPIEEMEGDHVVPWSQGGKTTIDNCQMLCKHCNRAKSDD